MSVMQIDLAFQTQLPLWLRLSVAFYPIGYTVDLSDRVMVAEYIHGIEWSNNNPKLAIPKTVAEWLRLYGGDHPTPRTLAFARGAVKLHYWAES